MDPGFGFGKTLSHNLQLLAGLQAFERLQCPLLVGLSRKSMFKMLLNADLDQRLPGSLSAAVLAVANGARIIRSHDVWQTVHAVDTAWAVASPWPRGERAMTGRRYFGTDGIRGRVGQAPISADFMLNLGRAAGTVLSRQHDGTVLIGKDTRISGYMFESVLEAGLVAAGVNVKLLGPMPTPAVAWLTRQMRGCAGIVISASHNPYVDNGIKFFDGRGEKLADKVEIAIEDEIDQPFSTVEPDRLGRADRVADAAEQYANFCISTFPPQLNLKGLTLVLDCAHGATYHIAPEVFARLGANVIPVGVSPVGLNINVERGSHPSGLPAAAGGGAPGGSGHCL